MEATRRLKKALNKPKMAQNILKPTDPELTIPGISIQVQVSFSLPIIIILDFVYAENKNCNCAMSHQPCGRQVF